jgi:hypothetical protein
MKMLSVMLFQSIAALPGILKERFATRFAGFGRKRKISVVLDTDFKIRLQRLIDREIEGKKGK